MALTPHDKARLRGILAAERAARFLQWAAVLAGLLGVIRHGWAAVILGAAFALVFRLARPALPPDLERKLYK